MKMAILILAGAALAASTTAEAKGQRVPFSGCPKARVIGGALCLFVGPYNITGVSPRPNPRRGLGVSGSGLRDPHITLCGGQRLSHVTWRYNKMKCPLGRRR